MRIGRSTHGTQAKVVVVTADAGFEEEVRATFGASAQVGLDVIKQKLSEDDQLAVDGATVVVADIDAGDAAEMAALSPLAVQGTKAVLAAGEGRSVAESLDYVATWNAGMLISEDLTEAMTAFLEKRPPKFTGR